MKAKNIELKNIILFICLFIATLFSSMLGAKIFGISLNKLALIPLIIYLLFVTLKGKNNFNKSSIILLYFFVLAILSSLFGFFASYGSNYSDYNTKLFNSIIQIIFIYFPLILGVSKFKDKDRVKNYLKKCILLVGKINIIVGLLQFALYYLFNYDLSSNLSIFYGADYEIGLINLPPLGIFIRPSGLCADSAFLGFILVAFFAFSSSFFWNLLAFVVAFLSMSRCAILTIVLLFIVKIFKEKRLTRIKISYIVSFFGILIAAIIIFNIPNVSNQISATIYRLTGISSSNSMDGTNRHVLYLTKSIEVLLTKYNPLQFLFGYGIGQSGTIITNYHVMDDVLSNSMFTTTWVIESDFSDILLSRGILGTIMYILILFNIGKINNQCFYLAIGILFMGLMYNVGTTTYALLIYIVLLGCNTKESKIKQPIINRARNHYIPSY